jgi:hypothetical protein
MKKSILIVACFLHSLISFGQLKSIELDKSPMDMSYFPFDYPKQKLNGKAKEQPIARIIYSRPQKNNREIFDGIVKYNELWRLGANEATEIEFFKNAKVNGKIVPKGKYTLYCIPTETKWTVILNKDNFCWGNFNYDIKKDIVRVDCKVEFISEIAEAFTAEFDETKTGANLIFMWDNVKVTLPIGF